MEFKAINIVRLLLPLIPPNIWLSQVLARVNLLLKCQILIKQKQTAPSELGRRS